MFSMKVFVFLLTFAPFLNTRMSCDAKVYFSESFSDPDWAKRWIQSKHKDDYGYLRLSSGDYYGNKQANQGIQTTENAKFYAFSTKFEPFTNKDKPLVIQYTVKVNESLECGGLYLKIFNCSVDPKDFHGDSPYSIMFGPDYCGYAASQIHVIFNYKGQVVPRKFGISYVPDPITHLFTLVVHPDNTYKVLVDSNLKAEGNLEDHWGFLSPKMVLDPSKRKPDDWDDREEVDDPNDVKPEDWDQPEFIPEPEATKPSEWDDGADGEWETPKIKNPEYKGEWKPKQIPNPNYKGSWVQPEMANPNYVPDPELYLQKEMCGIGFDLWQVQAGSIFDNILITDDVAYAKEEAEKNWEAYIKKEKEMRAKVKGVKNMAQQEEMNKDLERVMQKEMTGEGKTVLREVKTEEKLAEEESEPTGEGKTVVKEVKSEEDEDTEPTGERKTVLREVKTKENEETEPTEEEQTVFKEVKTEKNSEKEETATKTNKDELQFKKVAKDEQNFEDRDARIVKDAEKQESEKTLKEVHTEL